MMFYAKAMYLGGAIISCDEHEYLNYNSYKRDGLRCILCGDPVFLKSQQGILRRPHFAHFMDNGLDQNKCELRVTGYSSSWISLTSEGKGQRRKLFEKYFMNIIKNSTAMPC